MVVVVWLYNIEHRCPTRYFTQTHENRGKNLVRYRTRSVLLQDVSSANVTLLLLSRAVPSQTVCNEWDCTRCNGKRNNGSSSCWLIHSTFNTFVTEYVCICEYVSCGATIPSITSYYYYQHVFTIVDVMWCDILRRRRSVLAVAVSIHTLALKIWRTT